jgi:four helix bundle protein
MEDGGWKMAVIRSFRDLEVYKRAVLEARRIFEISKGFSREERYSLTDQIRRASRAVAAMIAEAWARRRYPAAFSNKLDEGLAEASETQAWLDHSLACEYLTSQEHRQYDAAWQSIGAMLNRMIDRADDFGRTATARR